jgi:hypothetical protein
MGLLSRVLITAAMIGLSAGQSHAAASGMADAPKPETFKQLAQGFEGGLFGGPCPSGQFLACWTEPYGRRFCGCWNGGDRPACPSGYYYTCRVAPDGRRTCACF